MNKLESRPVYSNSDGERALDRQTRNLPTKGDSEFPANPHDQRQVFLNYPSLSRAESSAGVCGRLVAIPSSGDESEQVRRRKVESSRVKMEGDPLSWNAGRVGERCKKSLGARAEERQL